MVDTPEFETVDCLCSFGGILGGLFESCLMVPTQQKSTTRLKTAEARTIENGYKFNAVEAVKTQRRSSENTRIQLRHKGLVTQ